MDINTYKQIIPYKSGIITGKHDSIIIKHNTNQNSWIQLDRLNSELTIYETNNEYKLSLNTLVGFTDSHEVGDICLSSNGDYIAITVIHDEQGVQGICILSKQTYGWIEQDYIPIKSDNNHYMHASNITYMQGVNILLVTVGETYENTILVFKFDNVSETYKLETAILEDQIYNSGQQAIDIIAINATDNTIQIVFTLNDFNQDTVRFYLANIYAEEDHLHSDVDDIFTVSGDSDIKQIFIEPNNQIRVYDQSLFDEDKSFEDNLKLIVESTEIYYLAEKNNRVTDKEGNAVTEITSQEIETLSIPVNTDQIKDPQEKEKMLKRHHLIIQHLLNNIAIAIKQEQPVEFELKSLEITEERIKLTGLKYNKK